MGVISRNFFISCWQITPPFCLDYSLKQHFSCDWCLQGSQYFTPTLNNFFQWLSQLSIETKSVWRKRVRLSNFFLWRSKNRCWAFFLPINVLFQAKLRHGNGSASYIATITQLWSNTTYVHLDHHLSWRNAIWLLVYF